MRTEPMESHGIRMPPRLWRKVETLAARQNTSRSDWLRDQIEALLSRVEDVHDTHEFGNDTTEGGLFDPDDEANDPTETAGA